MANGERVLKLPVGFCDVDIKQTQGRRFALEGGTS